MRLWNAHRRIYQKRVKPWVEIKQLQGKQDGWRKILAEDVVKFVDDLQQNGASAETLQAAIAGLVRDPSDYLSRPKNVPLELRKQIYLPDFVITLIRTPDRAPKYASFWVPLWFNKLDFKSYLKNVYNVDVLHVRSYVQQQAVRRSERQLGTAINGQNGKLFRPQARKKMIVELVDPFVYPDEEEDLTPWESEQYKREIKEQRDMAAEASDEPQMEPNRKQRESLLDQAQDLLSGKRKWKPSWQSIPADRILQGTSRPPGLRGTL